MRTMFFSAALALSFINFAYAATSGNVTALISCLEDKGYTPETMDDPRYKNDSTAFNLRLTFQPVALLYPSSSQNVSDMVTCAAANGFKVTARSGGHSYAAYGLGGQDGNLIIDMRNMTQLDLRDDGTVVTGPGNRLGVLATELWNQGERALPHGVCPYVGTGGHTSFGGFGLSSRKYGLLLDHVTSAEVVLANGTIITANDTTNDTNINDIFWAIRGSGPSFGIITSWTYQTIPAQDGIGFNISWQRDLNQSEFVSVYSAYQNFTQTAPSDLGFDGEIHGGLGAPISIFLFGMWYGDPEAFGPTILPFLNNLPANYSISAKSYNWIESLVFLSNIGTLDTSGPDRNDTFFVKSLQTKGPHTQDALESFAQFLYTQGVNADTKWFTGFALYGANSSISSVPPNATAYANRDAFITYQFYVSSVNKPFPSDGISFATDMLNSLEPNPQAAYPNYVDPTLTPAQWKAQYYGNNYNRLLSIKKFFDPNNVFDFPQAIGRA